MRHVGLSDHLSRMGVGVVLVSSDFNHLSKRSMRGELHLEGVSRTISEHDGIRFLWLKGLRYRGNGVRRLINMFDFAMKVISLGVPRGENRPDTVVGSSLHLPGAVAAYLLARRWRARFVLEVRDLWPESLVELAGMGRWHPFVLMNDWLARFLYRRSKVVITSMPLAEDRIRERGATPETRFFWIPNGCEVDRWCGGSPVIRMGGVSSFVLNYAGSLGHSNVVEELLAACRILKKEGRAEGLEVRIMGDGPDRPKLEEMAEADGLNFVHFEGRKSRDEAMKRLREGDASVLLIRPSAIYRWGYSMSKLADYMLAGRPVIASEVSPYRPVIDAGCGLHYQAGNPESLADCVWKLMRLPTGERERMGSRGVLYAKQNFDFEVLARRFKEALEAAA